MRPLRYSINVTLDGCCDHLAIPADEALHRHTAQWLDEADLLIFGRVVYQMMESAFRPPASGGPTDAPTDPFARIIDAKPKLVVSRTLDRVDWNASLLQGDLATTIRQLKQAPGRALATGGVTLPLALAQLDLIDEYTFVVHPRLAGHGPYPFAGLSHCVDLTLVGQEALGAGVVAMHYVPKR